MKRPLSFALRPFLLLLLAGLLLSSCSDNLWGSYEPLLTESPNPFWTLQATAPATTDAPRTPTATPFQVETDTPVPSTTPSGPTFTPDPPILYYAQSGDCLEAVAAHFGVEAAEISSSDPLPVSGLLDPETPLIIPNRLDDVRLGPSELMLPDSELVYSPTTLDFDIQAYVDGQGGYLRTYREYLMSAGWISGAGSVEKSAAENSINPRLLLALIEYESGWVRGQPANLAQTDYPLGYHDVHYRGLFRQMMWAVQELSIGYYGWRSGELTEITFPDGTTLRLAPDLNAGTAALQYYFSRKFSYEDWLLVVDPRAGFPAVYAEMFGDSWTRSAAIGPLFPPGLVQPELTLPFEPDRIWAYSGGPHSAWELEGALAALDFAPASADPGCVESDAWIVAPTAGRVVRVGTGVVVLDLDGDGYEQTGWNLLFLHVSTRDRAALGSWLEADARIGHPSCEGGIATGTHVHFARKYNGEWVLADGPLPFDLSGWIAHQGDAPYLGTLTRGDEVVIARTNGMFDTQLAREPDQ